MNAIYSPEDAEDIIGISVRYNSGVTCAIETDAAGVETTTDYTFTFDVMCDDTIFDMATVESQDLSTCDKKVVLNHNAGCPIYSALGFVNFMYANVWFSGSLLMLFGIIIGLFGKKWFGTITGIFGAMCASGIFIRTAPSTPQPATPPPATSTPPVQPTAPQQQAPSQLQGPLHAHPNPPCQRDSSKYPTSHSVGSGGRPLTHYVPGVPPWPGVPPKISAIRPCTVMRSPAHCSALR